MADDGPTASLDDSQRAYVADLIRAHYVVPPDRLIPLLSSLSSELAQSDTQISALRERLDSALSHRAKLQRLYDGCHAVSAPVRRLPAEILGEIFGWYIDDADHCTLDSCRFRLAWICARWRTIVLETAALWSKIYVNLADSSGTIPRLGSALDYGRNGPLALVVHADSRPPSSSVVNLLANHSPRWRHLAYYGPTLHLEQFAGVTGNLPILEKLTLHDWGFDSDADVSVLQTAPCLRSITTRVGSRVSLPPLEQLAFLKLDTVDWSGLAMELPRATALSEDSCFDLQFYLDDLGLSGTVHLNLSPTTLRVSRLRLEVDGEFRRNHCQQAFSQIFDSLTLPNLRALELSSTEFIRFPLIWPHARAITLFNRSALSTHLRVLNIADVNISEAQLRECLAALPYLEQLAIADHIRVRGRGSNVILVTDSLLRALACPGPNPSSQSSSGEVLVPSLDTFRIRSRMQFRTNVYIEFLLSRTPACEGKPFTVEIERHPEDPDARMDAVLYAELRRLQAEKRVVLDGVSVPAV
ncbi:hypothetical protein FB45DRAFT_445929 [Roridomyces roridus]|uniref:F-box domain-containing protein n=1 Tax=Roridomyces roridus TaxID=1738132 RepID=A0AAD7FSV2_9AGAR|nr:hypothetical protein FB45DRAFT_445929 [Roridomyces roridus]